MPVAQPFSAFGLSPVHLRPEVRGSVRLRGNDPFAPPKIHFDFMKSDYDMQVMLYGIRLARQIVRQQAMQKLIVEETSPGVNVRTDDEMIADTRERGISNLHPVGTCGMGRGPMAVVDPRLRVHGLSGLRVADASIMPVIVAGNTNAPSIMIGEKAADMMLQDAQAR